jgi:hypothetical protein
LSERLRQLRRLSSAILFATHVLIRASEGDNDGMVSVRSATWPSGLAENNWTDAEIGYDLNRPDLTTPFDFQGAIARIVKRATS